MVVVARADCFRLRRITSCETQNQLFTPPLICLCANMIGPRFSLSCAMKDPLNYVLSGASGLLRRY